MTRVSIVAWCLLSAGAAWAADTPTQSEVSVASERPAAITLAELARLNCEGVAVREVSDYVFGGYQGEFPSPPHADLNPKKAFIICWPDFPYRFVFAHEASYCPWFEFSRGGAAVCYQFFEGNLGWAELFNNWGRQERNSFVEIIEPGPHRVWVRWTYFGVNMQHGQPAYRGTEDFWAYPNGLIVRRQTFASLLNGDHRGYAREPMELIGLCPVGRRWCDVLQRAPGSDERHALAVLDAFSENRYDVFWTPIAGSVWDSTHRKSGCDWRDLDDSAGVVMAVPMTEGSPFCAFGDNSGFHHDYTRIKDLTFVSEAWGSICWDHWPIGWLNSQAHVVDAESWKQYPNHFSPLGMDLYALSDERVEQGVYYSVLGVGGDDWDVTRRCVRQWLEKGKVAMADPDSGADLPSVWTPRIILQQPQDVLIQAGRRAKLSVVTADGYAVAYQWQRASPGVANSGRANANTGVFQDIAGACGPDYTTDTLSDADNGVRFRCVLSLPGRTLTSLSATVCVDDAAPALVAARVPLDRSDRIVVVFSEPVVVPATAAGFTVDQGVEITEVAAGAVPHQLELAATPMSPGQTYTLAIRGVKDRVGHEISPNCTGSVDFSPLLPVDVGQVVSGFQDDFDAVVRDPHWVAVPADHDCYKQVDGVLQVTTMGVNPCHLIYKGLLRPGRSGSVGSHSSQTHRRGLQPHCRHFAGMRPRGYARGRSDQLDFPPRPGRYTGSSWPRIAIAR